MFLMVSAPRVLHVPALVSLIGYLMLCAALVLGDMRVLASAEGLELRWLWCRHRIAWPYVWAVAFKREFIGGRLTIVLAAADPVRLVVSTMQSLAYVDAAARHSMAIVPRAAAPAPLPRWLRLLF